jgi:hypothetical protein
VDEPGFSVAYAQMCGVLQKKQVSRKLTSIQKKIFTPKIDFFEF